MTTTVGYHILLGLSSEKCKSGRTLPHPSALPGQTTALSTTRGAGDLTTETRPALLIILDQHRVGLVRAAGEGQAAIAGPVEPEDSV